MASSSQVRVLIADERTLVCDMIASGLAAEPSLIVVGQANSFESAALVAARTAPDVAILGLSRSRIGVEERIHGLMLARPQCAVIALVDSEDDERLVEAVRAGAVGFMTMATSLEAVVELLVSAAARETVLPVEFTRRVLARASIGRASGRSPAMSRSLTEREVEILRLLMRGLANAEIARSLGVSTNTVKNHLHSIYRKLGVTSRGQAFATATQLGIAV